MFSVGLLRYKMYFINRVSLYMKPLVKSINFVAFILFFVLRKRDYISSTNGPIT